MNPVHENQKPLIRAAIIFLIVSWSACAFAVEINDRFLNALSWVESRDVDSAIGKRGEIGRFQMTEDAAKDALRFLRGGRSVAENSAGLEIRRMLVRSAASTALAKAYCELLNAQLRRKLKREPSHSEIYAAYNLGFAGFERRRFKISNCPKTTRLAAKQIEERIK